MATARGAGEAAERSSAGRSLGQLLGAGCLIGSVAFVLLLGAVLQVDPAATDLADLEPAAARPPTVRPALDFEAPPRAADRPAPRETAALTRRVVLDLERVQGAGGAWTAQLALLCDTARARALLTEFADEPELYLLPIEHDGQACFRICFGRFPDAEQARAVPGLPAGLRALQSQPLPKRITDVLAEPE